MVEEFSYFLLKKWIMLCDHRRSGAVRPHAGYQHRGEPGTHGGAPQRQGALPRRQILTHFSLEHALTQ